jgi:hypothetical protein
MNNNQGPEWVERAMALADSIRLADELAGDEDEASESDADRTWSALRAHLESREALVKQLAEALEELHYAHTDKADALARAALAAYQEKT